MKKRLAAMEEEAQKLKDEANAIGDDMNTGDGASGAADADRAETTRQVAATTRGQRRCLLHCQR